MSRRGRAAGFAALAVLCAIGSAAIASRYTSSVEGQIGELREVVAVTRPIAAGRPIRRAAIERSLELREVPVAFAPSDALGSVAEAAGRRPAAPIPPGSYLLTSQFVSPKPKPERGPELGGDLRPVEIEVAGAEALAASGPVGGRPVDVVVAREPTATRAGRVEVVASAVRMIALEQGESTDPASSAPVWIATLAVTKAEALNLIEAENFAREVRLVPR